MPKQKERKHELTVEMDGRTYRCERIVTGTRVLHQRVNVLGYGAESDQASYGPRDRPIATMEGIAKLIAQNIIRKAGNG